MNAKRLVTLIVFLLAVATVGLVTAQDTPKEQPMSQPGIEGTYQLVSRVLPDGTKQVPPIVGGMYTLTSKYQNFNIWWSNAEGKVFSLSEISEYSLTDSTYTETQIYFAMHDEGTEELIKYDFEQKTETVPVTRDGSKISFQLPFEQPVLVFDGDGITATLEGHFVDVWERVK